jgi:hypothetical protein
MAEVDQAMAKAIAEGILLAKVQEIFAKYGLSYSQ